jgi:hypothetical protein
MIIVLVLLLDIVVIDFEGEGSCADWGDVHVQTDAPPPAEEGEEDEEGRRELAAHDDEEEEGEEGEEEEEVGRTQEGQGELARTWLDGSFFDRVWTWETQLRLV